MRGSRGFTLIEISVALVLMGLVAGILLQFKQSDATDCNALTRDQLKQIERSMHDYVIAHDRFPVPALRTAGVENAQFGREAPIASLDAAGGVVFGALPFQALGLAPKFGGDCWGNKFTYAVTADLTDPVKFKSTSPSPVYDGVIALKSTASVTMNSKIAYAVISHGADAVGAVKINYNDASGTDRRWCGASTIIEHANCVASSNEVMAAEFNDGKDAGDKLFDDILIYGGKEQRVVNGQCDNSYPIGCLKGSVSNDNGQATCSTTRTWHCDGANGGTNDTTCTRANPVCLNCAPLTLPWSGGCSGLFPATAHGAISAPATANTNAGFTPASNASAACNNGVFSPPVGTCVAIPTPIPGACNNSAPLGCAAGPYASDNGATSCGTTRTWICQGQYGGPNSAPCSFANAACLNCGLQNLGWGSGCGATFPATLSGNTTVPLPNANPTYTGTGTATCTNGAFTASGTCTPVVPVPGACNNAILGGCAAGTLNAASLTNNGVCNTTSTWTCDGQNGGPPDTTCSAPNPPCANCGAGGLEWHGQCNDAVNSQVTCTAGEKPVFGPVAQLCIDGTYYGSVSCAPDASCVAPCNPATVTNGTVAAAPACTITCNAGYTLNGQTCVASGCVNPNNLYANNQPSARCTGNVSYISPADYTYINTYGVAAYFASHTAKCVGYIDMEPQGNSQADTAGSWLVTSDGGVASQASIYNLYGYPYPNIPMYVITGSGMVGAPGAWSFSVLGACN